MFVSEEVVWVVLGALAVNFVALGFMGWKLYEAYKFIVYLHVKRKADREENAKMLHEMQHLAHMMKQTHTALMVDRDLDSVEILQKYQKSLH